MSDETEKPDLVKQLEEKLKLGVEHHRQHVADVVLTLAFLSGNQWVKISKSRGVLPIDNSANEIRVTENRMLPVFRRRQFYLFKERPTMTAFEGGHELADAERASVASKLCDYWRSNCGWEKAERKAAGWTDVSGLSFLAPVWRKRPSMKRQVEAEEYSEEPVETKGKKSFVRKKTKETVDGEIAFDVHTSFNTFCFPLNADCWEKVTNMLTVDLCSLEWLENNLGQRLDGKDLIPIKPDEINLEAIQNTSQFVSPEFGFATLPAEEKQYLLLQWRERPSMKNPKGRHVVVAGGVVVHDGPLPYFEEIRDIDPTDEFNLTMGLIPWPSMDFPGRLMPPSLMGMLRQPQIRLNDLLTDEAANRKTVGRSKLLYEKGTIANDSWTDEHGEMIAIEPGTGRVKPTIIQGQPLVGITQEIERAKATFDETSGETSVLRGENPAQVRSAFHLDILREESLTLLFGDAKIRERVHELAAKICLSLARRRYSKERIIAIYGRDQAGRALTYKTADILTDIRVKEGSTQARNHAAREAKLVELLRYGAFVGPDGVTDMRMFWAMTELGTFNRAVNHDEKQRNRAREETVRMLGGEIIMPWSHENHDLHMEEHLGEMARPEWYAAGDEVRANLLAHVETHRQYRTNQLVPEANLPPMAPGMVEGAVQGAAGAPQPGMAAAGLRMV
jgi:hypothetical protein